VEAGPRLGEKIARHGTAVPRGQIPEGVDPREGRFGWMFERPPEETAVARWLPSVDAMEELVRLMWSRAAASDQRENPGIPAGYTYLGQFIDHDITFDPTSALEQRIDVRALRNFRTPRYDLDSVYGAGRVAQPYLYDWKESAPPGVRLLIGRNAVAGTEDLPRNQQGRALIGDPRNDENLITAQLHLLFIRFHNAVVDHLSALDGLDDDELFGEAQRLVRWHYQWIVVNEFLPRVVGEKTAAAVLEPGRDGMAPTVHRKYFTWEGREPFIPAEFSGAAYRFGHSMVRNQYGITRPAADGPRRHATDLFPDLAGFTWLSKDQVIDWERFFEFPEQEALAQPSFQIDASIVRPLFKLPERSRSLPRLNLQRGRRLGLPSGQEVAHLMEEPELPEEALFLDDQVPDEVRDELVYATPLWYYILCEAAYSEDGKHLGPIGGRIVAEVLVGLLEADRESYLNADEPWRPGELGTERDFRMADLVNFVRRSG
jgi:hypothetical protein